MKHILQSIEQIPLSLAGPLVLSVIEDCSVVSNLPHLDLKNSSVRLIQLTSRSFMGEI